MKKTMLILLSLLLIPAIACLARDRVDNSPVDNVNLDRYSGKWYEIARFDHVFEKGMDNTTALYELTADGKLRIVNSGWRGLDFSSREAVGKIPDGSKISTTGNNVKGLLRVSFFLPFYSDYRVLMLDNQHYEYALVGGGNGKYLWILARGPQLGEKEIDMILSEARNRGYDIDKLHWVDQNMNISTDE